MVGRNMQNGSRVKDWGIYLGVSNISFHSLGSEYTNVHFVIMIIPNIYALCVWI